MHGSTFQSSSYPVAKPDSTLKAAQLPTSEPMRAPLLSLIPSLWLAAEVLLAPLGTNTRNRSMAPHSATPFFPLPIGPCKQEETNKSFLGKPLQQLGTLWIEVRVCLELYLIYPDPWKVKLENYQCFLVYTLSKLLHKSYHFVFDHLQI